MRESAEIGMWKGAGPRGRAWASVAVGVLAGLALVLLAGGCAAAPEDDDGRLRVTATTGMIADAARNVAGEHARVTGLMGPGVDPHSYRPSQRALGALREADLILYNGLFLEGAMAGVLERLGERQPVVAVAEAVPEEQLLDSPDYEGAYDPHIWFDVSLWMVAVERIRDALMEHDPENAAAYEANAAAYLAELGALHEEARETLAGVPEEHRVLVTAHDAFGYFGRAYDVEVMALQGISTAAEFGLHEVTSLARVIAEREIKAVFPESTISPRSVRALIEGVEGLGHEVREGGTLFSDAMGEPGTPEGTYVGMVRHNVNTIAEALR